MTTWQQPAPTKRFAVYYDGAWWGEGDDAQAAWGDVRRQMSPGYSREGAILFGKIKAHGEVKETANA